MVCMRDEMGTAYVTDWLTLEFQNICKAHAGETIDLAGMSFTDGGYRALERCMDTCNFVDSSNEYLDKVLKHNSRAVKLVGQDVMEFEPDFDDMHDMFGRWLHSLKAGKTYAITQEKTYTNSYKFALYDIINLMRPGVRIAMRGMARGYISHVSSLWKKTAGWKGYYAVVDNALAVVQVDDGYITWEGQKIPELEFITDHDCIPCDFGRKSVKELPEFEGVLKSAVKVIEYSLTKKKKLLDYLEVN